MDKYDVQISEFISLRIYSDSKPKKWKTATLQKGLILLHNGSELVGASSGFGCPVLQYQNESYFSGSSRVYVHEGESFTEITKFFVMDRLKRNRLANVTLRDQKVRSLLDNVGLLYRLHLRFTKIKNLLVKLGVRTDFIKTAPIGVVTTTYRIDGKEISVDVDLRDIERRNLTKVLLLNEQGARCFRVYSDSNLTTCLDEKIGQWRIVAGDWATLANLEGNISFRLRNAKGCILRRGQEYIEGFLDWAGLNYEIKPEKQTFTYEIKITSAR